MLACAGKFAVPIDAREPVSGPLRTRLRIAAPPKRGNAKLPRRDRRANRPIRTPDSASGDREREMAAPTGGMCGRFGLFTKIAQIQRLDGGGGRTRTYEGIASGFTVRPLCHSGHSPGVHIAVICANQSFLDRPQSQNPANKPRRDYFRCWQAKAKRKCAAKKLEHVQAGKVYNFSATCSRWDQFAAAYGKAAPPCQ